MTNVAIQINGEYADIDEQTAIGFNFQSFNPASPENVFLSYSNTFSLPLTAKNRKLIKFSDHVCYNSTEIYDKFEADVFLCGYKLFHGLVLVDSIVDRINMTVYDKLDFVETLKNIFFARLNTEQTTVQGLLVDYVNANNSFAYYSDIIQYMASGTHDIWLPYSLGSLSEHYIAESGEFKDGRKVEPRSTTATRKANALIGQNTQKYGNISIGLEDKYGKMTHKTQVGIPPVEIEVETFDDYMNVCLCQYFGEANAWYGLNRTPSTRIGVNYKMGKIAKGIKTGHLMGKIPTIVDLIFDAIGVESNLSQLAEIQDLFVRVPDIAPVMMYDYNTNTYWQQFTKVFKGAYDYENFENEICMSDTTAWDLIKALIQEFNLVVDRSYNIATGKQVYNFYKFNDIKTAEKVQYRLTEIQEKNFKIDGIKQKSVIVYEGTGGEDDTDTSAGLLVECANKNIEEGSDKDTLFKIGRYLPSYYAVSDGDTLTNYLDIDLSEVDNMGKIIFLTPDFDHYANCNVWTLYEPAYNYAVETKYQRIGLLQNNVRTNVGLLVAKQPAVVSSGMYDQYQKMVKYPLVYKVNVVAEVANAMRHRYFQLCNISGLVGDYFIASIENYNPSTDKYFTMTVYRIEREIAEGEPIDYLLATETPGGAYVITETNEGDKFITKE